MRLIGRVFNSSKTFTEGLKNIIVVATFFGLFALFQYLKPNGVFTIYGILLLIYLLSKMVFSFIYKPETRPAQDYVVDCVIPSYNESGDSLISTVNSVLAQTYPIRRIYVIDDGSPDETGIRDLMTWAENNWESCNNLVIWILGENQGKRHAQAWAFSRSDAQIFFTVDSDTDVEPNALEELIKVFNDKEVYAVTGHINARNRDFNLLTRLIDIRYDNAFRVERAAQSVTGNILTCSGPLSCYRREVIIPNLEHYMNQWFLGVKVNIGDDRCLTNYANRLGKTRYQSTARCVTDVPTSLKVFLKQQIRWNKSFYRESLVAIRMMLSRPFVSLWAIIEVCLTVLLTWSTVRLFFDFHGSQDGLRFIGFLLLGVIISSLARNVYYVVKHPFLFLLSPLYALVHIVFLQPLRIFALLTIRDVRWGTRQKKKKQVL